MAQRRKTASELASDQTGLVWWPEAAEKKELAWPPGLEVENGHRKVDG